MDRRAPFLVDLTMPEICDNLEVDQSVCLARLVHAFNWHPQDSIELIKKYLTNKSNLAGHEGLASVFQLMLSVCYLFRNDITEAR